MSKRKLVCLMTNHDDDIYCFRKELIEGLISDGYEVLISCPYGEKLELMKDINFKYCDVKIDRRGTNVLADLKLVLHYHKMLKEYKPDIVLTYTAKPNVYGSLAASWLKIPYINNVTGLGSVINKKGILRSLIMLLFRNSYKRSSCIFFQNRENMELALKQRFVKGDYKLIPGSGVNTERFPLQPYPNDSDTIVFNYIGRVLKDKGVDDYIEAAKRIKKNYPNTEFNIIGFIEPTEKYYEDDLKQLQDQGIIMYRGSQKDVKPWIERSHAIIHPSTYGEGMSNVLLENASSGRFLITTDNPGCQETVVDGKSGFIYHGGDVDALVKTVERFLDLSNETRKAMGIAGRKYVEDKFSRVIVVKAYKKKVGELVGDEHYR